jgi:OPT oligopeptide transporter protein
MIWPSNLINVTLFRTLFREQDPKVPGWKISRFRYFLYCFAGMFLWTWIPGYIFTGLSTFAFVTWIKPNNVVINQIFGAWTGNMHYWSLS